MKFLRSVILILIFNCSLSVWSQSLTATYIELADSADYYISRKKWLEAESVIIKALKHEPANKSNFLLWSNLGIVRENLDNYDGAIEAYTVGLATAPKSTVLLTNRARAYLVKNEKKHALNDLQKALEMDSTLQWPLKMEGLLYASLGEQDKALVSFRSYTERYGKDADISETAGNIYASRSNVDDALICYRESYKLNPSPETLEKIVLTAYLFGRIDEVEEEIMEGVKKYPRDGMMYLMRAMLNKSRYQTDAYESDLKTAINLGVNREILNQLVKK